jgi:sugar phosphate isomerase/epimerase
MASLSLHHLTIADASAPQLVSIAAELGCEAVTLFAYVPPAGRAFVPVLEGEQKIREVVSRCRDLGVAVHNVEYFPIDPHCDFNAVARGFDLATRLGARRATCQIHDADLARAQDSFARLCALALQHEMQVGLEFMAFAKIKTVSSSVQFLRAVNCINADIAIDALHLFRGGGTLAEVRDLPAEIVRYVQLCDGPASVTPGYALHEAMAERQLAGSGVFRLRELIDAVPREALFDVEVPMQSLKDAGETPRDRAAKALATTRALFISDLD